jgi:hypothetical protein
MTAQHDPDEVQHVVGLPWSENELRTMSRRFIAAMAAAIRSGEERPPRVGIDQTPGTKKPRFVSVRARTSLRASGEYG